MSGAHDRHADPLDHWRHDHVFEQDTKRAGEARTLLVVVITAVMMVVEIIAGIVYGSMALLADGLHMASHAAALGIAVLAYVVSRRLARDSGFTFGVGKINSLAGFTSAVLLMGFALLMVTESVDRLIHPLPIEFDHALLVAAIGLAVNGACAWILMSTPHEHGHGHREVEQAPMIGRQDDRSVVRERQHLGELEVGQGPRRPREPSSGALKPIVLGRRREGRRGKGCWGNRWRGHGATL